MLAISSRHTDSQGVKLGIQKHNQCYAGMCNWLESQENGCIHCTDVWDVTYIVTCSILSEKVNFKNVITL